ncbi:MAG: DUF393 domain-containing protein [Verrucomicrobiales bacterium]|nr:DUF393 domain-containing protein [Verrucomicrobiales bacterium]
MNTLTIFYDAHCGLCSRFRAWMQAQPSWVRLEFLPYDSAEARRRCPQLPSLRADEEIVVLADDGSLWQGAGAWITCLWALQDYREWSARLATPALQAVAKSVVHWISSRRLRLSQLLRLSGDDLLRAAGSPATCRDGSCKVEARSLTPDLP